MAELEVDGEDLVVKQTGFEKAESVHADPKVPLSSVRRVEVLDDAIGAVHGFRVGTGIPGSVAVGTFTSRDARIFAVVHHDTPRGVHVVMEGAKYDEFVVGCPDPESMAAEISRAAGLPG
jgi:hypothetical protein